LNFLKRIKGRIRTADERRIAIIYSRQNAGSNQGLGGIFRKYVVK
jgi:hypothetical protein